MSLLPSAAFIAFLIVQRLGELVIARRNTARLMARGGVEHGAAHYPLIVAMHSAWIACIALFGWGAAVSLPWLAAFALLQVLRAWILLSLGGRWTTRIITVPEPPVRRGPYRWISHPNYALVVAEIAVAPMVLGLTWVALLFTALNAAILTIRIRAENRALREIGAGGAQSGRPGGATAETAG
ncbi:isoprenylcysteine carboxyl methyltransferase family protein [Pseudoroseicyclus sp. H15]